MPQTQQCGIQAVSATYTAACGKTRSLTHWARPGTELASSWIIVGFLTCWATSGTPSSFIYKIFCIYTTWILTNNKHNLYIPLNQCIHYRICQNRHLKWIIYMSSCHGAAETNLTRIHEDEGSIPGLAQWVNRSSIATSCSVGRRCSLDLVLLWLWCRPVALQLQFEP